MRARIAYLKVISDRYLGSAAASALAFAGPSLEYPKSRASTLSGKLPKTSAAWSFHASLPSWPQCSGVELGHTSPGARQFKQLQLAGAIDGIVKIEAYKDPSLWFMDAAQRINKFPKVESIPSSLNYDLWCGPAKMMPYSRRYHPFDWRAFYIYGNGMLGDWGAHIIDFAHNYLKLGLPIKVEALRMDDHNKVIFPLSSQVPDRA